MTIIADTLNTGLVRLIGGTRKYDSGLLHSGLHCGWRAAV